MPSYRYELRRGDEILATGMLSEDQPLAVGSAITIAGVRGAVRVVAPMVGTGELQLFIEADEDAPPR